MELPFESAQLVDESAGARAVVAAVLGGSRASGAADEHSDWDLALVYRGTPDLGAGRRRTLIAARPRGGIRGRLPPHVPRMWSFESPTAPATAATLQLVSLAPLFVRRAPAAATEADATAAR